MLKKILDNNNELIALVISANHKKDGIEFFTPPNFSQQLAYMNHPGGMEIAPHLHKKIHREVHFTQEVLFIKSGKVRVDLYDDKKDYLQSLTLETGDVILLSSGGHGFTMLEPTEMIEVKQGPFLGDQDKTRFQSIGEGELRY